MQRVAGHMSLAAIHGARIGRRVAGLGSSSGTWCAVGQDFCWICWICWRSSESYAALSTVRFNVQVWAVDADGF